MKQFVPFSDDWFDHPGAMPGPLVPYRPGMIGERGAGSHPMRCSEASAHARSAHGRGGEAADLTQRRSRR